MHTTSLRTTRRARSRGNKRLEPGRFRLEALECRRLLAADDPTGIVPLPIEPAVGVVHGQKWEDLDGDGRRDEGEPGLGGVTIYADLNWNGTHDRGEPSTVTQRDLPETDFDEAGLYTLSDVPAGERLIREVVPAGYAQTYPGALAVPLDPPIVEDGGGFARVEPPILELPLHPGETFVESVAITVDPVCFRAFQVDVVSSDPSVKLENLSGIQLNGCGGDVSRFEVAITAERVPLNFEIQFIDAEFLGVLGSIPVFSAPEPHLDGGHLVRIVPDGGVDGIDFGNARRPTGAIEGRKWLDRDGNGQWDPGEAGLGGVTIYADLNDNGQPDRGEPRAVTAYEDPDTDFDEAGWYQLSGLRPGPYVVREVIPRDFTQTFPGPDGTVSDSQTGRMNAGVAIDLDVTDVIAVHETGASLLDAELELTVVWPDSCGTLIDADTAYTVVGDHIVVELAGHQVGAACADVISPQPTHVKLSGLHAGRYQVVATLHESLTSGAEGIPTLTTVAQIALGGTGAHRVQVARNELVSDINFGNRWSVEPGSIAGLKWRDDNGNGVRDEGEPGLAGVTIYVDTNSNGQWDRGEPAGVSTTDDVATVDIDETGQYRIDEIPSGTWRVREIVPPGYLQTFPEPRFGPPDDIWFPFPTDPAYEVTVGPGTHTGGLDFGNQPIVPAEVHGTKWLDANGDGQRGADEPGLPGVTIYVDLNNNDHLDRGEPATRSMADDPATTDVDETGAYWLTDLTPGTVIVREVVPAGYQQTFPPELVIDFPPPGDFPLPDAQWWDIFGRFHQLQLGSGEVVTGIDFGNQQVTTGSVGGTKWFDINGDGRRDANEPGVAGVVIFADLNGNQMQDRLEPATRTQSDDPATAADETGQYLLTGLAPGVYAIREVLPPNSIQTFPAGGSQMAGAESQDLPPGRALSFDLIDVQAEAGADGVWGAVLTLQVVWPDGCGSLVDAATTFDFDGVGIHVQLLGTQVADVCTQALVEQTVTIHVPNVADGDFYLEAILRESDEPGGPSEDAFLLSAKFTLGGDGEHRVTIRSGEQLSGIDFGNQLSEVPPPDDVPPDADMDHNGRLDARDIDLLSAAIRAAESGAGQPAEAHDLTGDRQLDVTDLEYLVEGLMKMRFGDANLDGVFDSSDLVKVFQVGEYEDQQDGNSGWQEGDWDGDGDFTSSDLVFAFQHGGYEQAAVSARISPRAADAALAWRGRLEADKMSSRRRR